MNKLVIGLISILAIFGFLLIAYKLTNTPQNKEYPQVNKVGSDDHIKWSAQKKNILVEYSDLQCPACKAFHELIGGQIEASASGNADITKKITFVYRHFPLIQHQYAEEAAFAAEAAGKQGKFFEMADRLFKNQEAWAKSKNPKKEFEAYVNDLKLDLEKYKKDYNSKETKEKVSADLLSGQQADVNATPTFYLNGKKLDTVRSFDEFIRLLKNI